MESIGSLRFGQNVAPPKMDDLANTSLHRLGDLPGISGDDDASRAAYVEVVDRNALEEKRIERICQKDRDRKAMLPAEFSKR